MTGEQNRNGKEWITNWSRWLGWFSRFWMVGGPVVMLGSWIALPWLPEYFRQMLFSSEIHSVTWRVQVLGFLSALPGAVVHVLLFLKLIELFGLWRQGVLLEDANVACFRSMGNLYLASTIVEILSRPIRTLAESVENLPGHRTISFGLSSDDMRLLFLAFFLWMLAYVVDQGRKYRQESELTI